MYILVDTSIWVNLFSKTPRFRLSNEELLRLAVCGPVIQEVLQGLRETREGKIAREQFLFLPRLSDPLPVNLFVSAANIYSSGRARGYTIRSSVDCLIAAVAIENNVPVWHLDRDFDLISKFTSLNVVREL